MDATGLETASEHTSEPKKAANADRGVSETPALDRPKSAFVRELPETISDPVPETRGPVEARVDPVAIALARALELAAQAGEWAVVSELGRQLEARRRARP